VALLGAAAAALVELLGAAAAVLVELFGAFGGEWRVLLAWVVGGGAAELAELDVEEGIALAGGETDNEG
jgi:hypothetical protein